VDWNAPKMMDGDLDSKGVRVWERLSDWVGPMVDSFQLGVLGFLAEGRIVNSD